MKKTALTKELIDIANELDGLSLFSEANTITKIANIIIAEEIKSDPMVYNPDDKASDDLDVKADEFDNLIGMLNDAKDSGELSDEDIHSIMNILHQESGKGPMEMSYDEDDDFDPDYGDDSDYDDEDPGDPHAWQYEDDVDDDLLDKEHKQHGRGGMEYPDLDDDF